MKKLKKPRIDKFKFYDLVIYAARGSHSARRLAAYLGSRRWRDDLPERYTRRRPYFRGNSAPMVINWGSTQPAGWLHDPRFRLKPIWINSAEACHRAIDKAAFFSTFGEGSTVPVLRHTVDVAEAKRWLEKNFRVVARKTTTGSHGAGIVVVQPGETLPKAPLYTRYYPKTHEFRAHIFKGKLIDFTQKKLKGGPSDAANRLVRNHDNGWVYCHGDLDVSAEDISKISQGCVDCISALGLDFGAVDILATLDNYRNLTGYRICEVNTGPGLENEATIQAYAKAILEEKAKVHNVRKS